MNVRSDNFHIWTFAHTLVPKTNAQTSNVNPLMPKEKKKKKNASKQTSGLVDLVLLEIFFLAAALNI